MCNLKHKIKLVSDIKIPMVQISAFKTINAKREKIWEIISDVDSDPLYWHGIKKVKNLKKGPNYLERETVIAFRKSTCTEIINFKESAEIDFKIIKGPIIGSKTLILSEIPDQSFKLEANWEIKLKAPLNIFAFIVGNHIKKGTKEALDRIAHECERTK